jgi:hypothetical protein
MVAMGLLTHQSAAGSPLPLAIEKLEDIRARLSTLEQKEPPTSPNRNVRLAQYWGNFPNWPNWPNWGGWVKRMARSLPWPLK